MKKRFQNLVTTGRFTLPVAAMLSAACWLLAYVLLPDAERNQGEYQLLGFALYAFVGFLLIQFNNMFAIIRVRASVQTSIYSLLIAVCPQLHTLAASDVATLLFLLSLFLLFKSYRQAQPMGILFHTFVCIGIGSLFFPQLTFFAPMLWIGAFSFQSLTFKSFLASLLGWGLPYWFLLGYGFCCDKMELFCRPFRELATFAPVCYDHLPWVWVVLGYSAVLFLVSMAHCWVVSYEDKMRTRSYLQFFIQLTLYTFIYMALQPSLTLKLLPLLFISISFLSGHLFALTASRSSNLFFICALIGMIALFVFNLFFNP